MAKPKVLITYKHPGKAVDTLFAECDAVMPSTGLPLDAIGLKAMLEGCDGVVPVLEDRFDEQLFAHHPQLKLIANVAVGYDNIDVSAANKHEVLVLNTPGVLDETTADLAFALMLAVSRRVVEADKFVRAGNWKRFEFDLLLGNDVHGKTIGIVGLGRIGKAMARRARAFNMKVLYHQRNALDASTETELGCEYCTLDELLTRSDFVSLHCPLTSETRHLLGAEQFRRMKRSAYLINTARGAVVDQPALVEALQQGLIKGAGLDVFEQEPAVPAELFTMDNVVLAPHLGSGTIETRSAMALMAVRTLLDAFAGKMPPNMVNPECWESFLRRTQQVRSAG